MKSYVKFLALFVVISFCFCNKESKIDPCVERLPFSANFTIQEKVGDSSFVTDKILENSTAYFVAEGKYDSVRWQVGNAQNTSTRTEYALNFFSPEEDIPVTMIGYRKADMQCFPNDKTVDTVTKMLSVLPRDHTAPLVGQYHGYNESNPSDTFTVTITWYDEVWGYHIKNLPKGCPGYTTTSDAGPDNIGLSIRVGFNGFNIRSGSPVCSIVTGNGYLINPDSLKIQYSFFPAVTTNPYSFSNDAVNETFIGVRKD